MACPKCGSRNTWDDNFWSGCNSCGWMNNCERAFELGRLRMVPNYSESPVDPDAGINPYADDD